MHLEDHLHQFDVYMKSTNTNLPNSLLQQFNFGDTTEAAAVEGSEKATAAHDSEVEPKDEIQPTPKEADGAESDENSSTK